MTWEEFAAFCSWLHNNRDDAPFFSAEMFKEEVFIHGRLTKEHFDQWQQERGNHENPVL